MSGQPDSFYRLQKRDVRRAAIRFTDAFQHDPIRKAVLQGRGFAGKLFRALVEECERTGMSLYLETESNVRMYERFGFVVVREIVVSVINLPM